VMRDHQKYFAVQDGVGKLAPHFLTVLNISTDENSAAIIRQGNERVLRARFNDAKFFWEFDQRVPLVERVKLLENVMFQKDLGSYAAKSERVGNIAAKLVLLANERGAKVDGTVVGEAARLTKTDLTTELVKEFTELQGIIGGLYAEAQGISKPVSDSIYDQYLPASGKDKLPRSREGALLGLADRIDTITSMFGLGMEPTGSKDPFALRRAANAVVRILAESGLPLLLSDLSRAAEPTLEVEPKLQKFFVERVDFYLREVRGQSYDVVAAVLASGADNVRDVAARAEAVSAMRGSDDFVAVCAAFKRMKNILEQADARGDVRFAANEQGLIPPAVESNLVDASDEVRRGVDALAQTSQYVAALKLIATLRPSIDGFFDQVMVIDPNPTIRGQRLYLLGLIISNIRQIADLSEIVTTG